MKAGFTEGKTKTEVKQTDDPRHPIAPPPAPLPMAPEPSTPCVWCDPSFGCFDRSEPCQKRPQSLLEVGAICGICGFQYREHKGHIIPCPVCALSAARTGADEALAEKLMRNLMTTPDAVRLDSFRHEVLDHLTVGDLRRASEIIHKLSRKEL